MAPSSSPSLLFRLSLVPIMLASLGGCSGRSTSDAPPSNGVDDVLLACQSRVSWNNASTTACNTCIGYAITPRCACSDKDFAGKCSSQESARIGEATCEGVNECINACTRSDCTCVDACYSGKPTCRARASAVDGCVAETCEAYCR